MKIKYKNFNFRKETLMIIEKANEIIEDYSDQGFELTLRQLYYQFVAKDLVENTERSYKKLGTIVNNARLCGEISWEAIEDRTREVRGEFHWDSPKEIIDTYSSHFSLDKWENQPWYVEVWIEKDALVGVIEDVCNRNDVKYFSCRGYVSQSEMWGAARRIIKSKKEYAKIIHLGDHDPSGIDMTRDISERLSMFGASVEVKRIALNMNQIEELSPPPNPAKITDSRAKDYIKKYGKSSWELDALEPNYISRTIEEEVSLVRDDSLLGEILKNERAGKENMGKISSNWEEVIEYLSER